MLELTVVQTLIARLTDIGLASAVFTYYLIKLLIKSKIDVKLEANPYREYANNVARSAVPVEDFGGTGDNNDC